ncbi:NAD(P)/FAD-dependent oxidoreductase [Bacillus tuaregi]|uniref:NAD(P)/FAD-dependent oxidoreductase n=1 Tax=Bacillus tuaregi TaxID=1816695 RepID=UPI0008F8D6F0|nr:FAD-dependent oxidoreductase [Bacillus tuaregi]
MNKNYCIIGSGVAAVNAAKAIRDHDKEANIHVFGAEKSLPYNRIKLSKDLYSDLHAEKVLIKKEKWYQDQNILVHIDSKITALNTDMHEIVTESGEIYSYDKLLICTGSQNRKLTIDGAEKKGVFTIREMQEADDFKAFIEDKQHVVNIGGGIQGLETAWSIHKQGKQVSIIEAAPRLMARQLDEKTSELLKMKIEAAGVQVLVNSSIEKINGEADVAGIVVNHQELACDSVIYAIGVIPNVELVKNTDIAVNRGIIVNDRMQTTVADVYAAGDVAEWNGEVAALWNPAMDQGKVAGKNMAAASSLTYQRSIPLTVFNAFDFALFSIGLVDENQCDTTIIEEDEAGNYTRVFIKDEKMVGAISLEGVVASLPYKAAIENEVSLAGIELGQVTVSELMSQLKKRQKLSA